MNSPLENGDHLELDTSEIPCINDMKKYQSLIGSLQCAVSLRHWINVKVIAMDCSRPSRRAITTSSVGHCQQNKLLS